MTLPRGLDASVRGMGFGLGLIAPVEPAEAPDAAHTERNPEEGMPVPSTGFEQQDTQPAIGAESLLEHAAGRACADDDVIELAHRRTHLDAIAKFPLRP
jgi:hypothetical protein